MCAKNKQNIEGGRTLHNSWKKKQIFFIKDALTSSYTASFNIITLYTEKVDDLWQTATGFWCRCIHYAVPPLPPPSTAPRVWTTAAAQSHSLHFPLLRLGRGRARVPLAKELITGTPRKATTIDVQARDDTSASVTCSRGENIVCAVVHATIVYQIICTNLRDAYYYQLYGIASESITITIRFLRNYYYIPGSRA